MVWFGGATSGSFVWNTDAYPIKNRVTGMALALSSQNLTGKHNNQPSVGIGGGSESGEVARGGGKPMGKRCLIVWDVEWSNAKIMKIKYTVA